MLPSNKRGLCSMTGVCQERSEHARHLFPPHPAEPGKDGAAPVPGAGRARSPPARARGGKAALGCPAAPPALLPVPLQPRRLQQHKTEEDQQQPQPFIEGQSHRALSCTTQAVGTAPPHAARGVPREGATAGGGGGGSRRQRCARLGWAKGTPRDHQVPKRCLMRPPCPITLPGTQLP